MQTAEAQSIPKLVIRKTLRAKRERVFEAWTKPELIAQWLNPQEGWTSRTKNSLRVGGRYEHEMIVGGSQSSCVMGLKVGDTIMHQGEYLEIVPPERLVFTWNTPAVQNTRVTIELKDLGDSTELWLTHELFDTEAARASHEGGWGACLASLEAFLSQ